MFRYLVATALFAAYVMSATALFAQDRNYWLQTKSFPQFSDASRFKDKLSDSVTGLRIFRSSRDRYLVVTGPYRKREAALLRARLISRGLISDTSSITVGRHFRGQVWPSEGGAGEAERRADSSRFRLSGEDAFAAQTALKWFGDYSGAIDGIIGSETSAAIRALQARTGTAATGRLTAQGFRELMNLYRAEVETAGMEPVVRRAAGMSLDIPSRMLRFSRVEEPFVYFDPAPGHRLQLFLISLPGNYLAFENLFHALQANSFIPVGGQRNLGRSRFEIRSDGAAVSAYADVRLFENRMKGYVLVWHPQDSGPMTRIVRAMSESLHETSESTLSMPTGAVAAGSAPPLVNLDLPRPKLRLSGFFLDAQGTVATGSAVADSCDRIFLFPNHEMRLGAADRDGGIALLLPVGIQVPLAHARLRMTEISKGDPVSVSGFPFGGELGSPSQSSGVWNGADPRPDRSGFGLMAADVYPGDIGGPVLDESGSVAGILVAEQPSLRPLPDGVHSVATTVMLIRLADSSGISTQRSAADGALHVADLARAAGDITVLVECY